MSCLKATSIPLAPTRQAFVAGLLRAGPGHREPSRGRGHKAGWAEADAHPGSGPSASNAGCREDPSQGRETLQPPFLPPCQKPTGHNALTLWGPGSRMWKSVADPPRVKRRGTPEIPPPGVHLDGGTAAVHTGHACVHGSVTPTGDTQTPKDKRTWHTPHGRGNEALAHSAAWTTRRSVTQHVVPLR